MTVSSTTEIGWSGQMFHSAKAIGVTDDGSFIVSLWTTPAPEPRGSYFTSVPISPAAYRATRPTQCGFARPSDGELIVFCDWGRGHSIKAAAEVLDAIEREAVASNIPNRGLQA